MSTQQRTRTLLSSADPVRDLSVPPPRLSAADLIRRAEAGAAGHSAVGHTAAPARTPNRRLLLVAASLTLVGVVVAASYPLLRADPGGSAGGAVLVPIAYQITDNPPPAGAQLRALADRIDDAPYDRQTGRYTHLRVRNWGAIVQSDQKGHAYSHTEENESWIAADGSGRERTTTLEPEYQDEETRRLWDGVVGREVGRQWTSDVGPGQLSPGTPVPSDRAGLARRLNVEHGPHAAAKAVGGLSSITAIDRPTRSEILRVLADMPGFVWRGEVTDRAGRPGVAITADQGDHQTVLVFDARTAVLLAQELVSLKDHWLDYYLLVLEVDRTERLG